MVAALLLPVAGRHAGNGGLEFRPAGSQKPIERKPQPLGMAMDVMAVPPDVAANSFVPCEVEERLTVSAVLLTLP